MDKELNENKIDIDARGQRLGHLATHVASLLQGKDLPQFAKNIYPKRIIRISNANKLDIPVSKKSKEYQSYSGYPGGRKVETLNHLAKRRGFAEIIRRTIAGMLPKNKLHKKIMHNLVITE